MREAVEGALQALIEDEGGIPHSGRVGGVLRPIGPRDARIEDDDKQRACSKGTHGRPRGPDLAGDEQVGHEDQGDQFDGRGQTDQHATGQDPTSDTGRGRQVGQDQRTQHQVDLAEVEGQTYRVKEIRRPEEHQCPKQQTGSVDAGDDRPEGECQHGIEAEYVARRPRHLSCLTSHERKGPERQSRNRRVGERKVRRRR